MQYIPDEEGFVEDADIPTKPAPQKIPPATQKTSIPPAPSKTIVEHNQSIFYI
jgi:hypothetical protein